tara:strand:+ start:4850 stop:7255 length:2406 start_codon:yes stop_codon:yes gene_type:complete
MIQLLKSIIFTVFFIVGLSSLIAQSNEPSIKGKIIDEANSPVPFANIVLYNSLDSSLVKGTTSDIDGLFTLAAKPGNYYLIVSFLSFQSKTISPVNFKDTNLDLGKILLRPKSQELEEVEITGQKNQMEFKLDKRIFNIEKDLANAGANAAEILNNIPSVEVDIEGNISLRGSGNVRVLIDGKPSTITGSSTADVLRQFQGSMIERVEVVTNPSARYDAEGEVGIINIVLKKEQQKGLNGSIELVGGYPDNHRLSYNLNYRTKKFNIFNSYGVSYRNSPGSGSNYQRFANPDTSYLYTSKTDRLRGGLAHNVRFGSDIFLNDKNTITLTGFYSYSDEENNTTLNYRDLFDSGELLREVERIDNEDEYGTNIETSINYTKEYDKKDKKLTADIQYSERDDLEKSSISEVDYSTADRLLQDVRNVEANQNILIQSDFVDPVGKDGLFETGFRNTLRTVNNNFRVGESLNNSEFTIIPEFNNEFVYTENVYAAYLMFGNKFKQFSYQLGVRSEYSDISTELKLTDEKNSWEYLDFFPSAFLTYEMTKTTSFQASYSRRINRPNYRYLMPFRTFSDNRNLWAGNADLQPEYTDSYEIGYLKYFKKGSLFSSLYYRHRTNVISRITTANSEGFTVRLPVNLATEENIGLEVNGNYRFTDKISINGNLNFYRAMTFGSYEGENLDNDVFTWSGRSILKMEVLPKLELQSTFNYRAPQNTAQGRMLSLYSLDLSLGKDVMKGKGTLVASVRDVFNTRRRRSIIETEYLFSESDFQWRARQFLLSFTYRINQKKNRDNSKSREDMNDDF